MNVATYLHYDFITVMKSLLLPTQLECCPKWLTFYWHSEGETHALTWQIGTANSQQYWDKETSRHTHPKSIPTSYIFSFTKRQMSRKSFNSNMFWKLHYLTTTMDQLREITDQ